MGLVKGVIDYIRDNVRAWPDSISSNFKYIELS